MKIDTTITAESLKGQLDQFWELSGQKIDLIENSDDETSNSGMSNQ